MTSLDAATKPHTPAQQTLAPLSAAEEDFMRALARCLVYIPRVFMADLGREHGLSTSEYFVLMHLSESTDGRLRMGDLASATALSDGAVTRVVKALEGKALVERRQSQADGRVTEAALTQAGHSRLALAYPAHLASVRRRIFDRIEGLDVAAGTQLLERLTAGTP